jgi:hypothetical protein
MSIDYFIDFSIAILHFLPVSQCVGESLLAREAVNSGILHTIDEWMLGAVTMLV